jgi:hypothetical protein
LVTQIIKGKQLYYKCEVAKAKFWESLTYMFFYSNFELLPKFWKSNEVSFSNKQESLKVLSHIYIIIVPWDNRGIIKYRYKNKII